MKIALATALVLLVAPPLLAQEGEVTPFGTQEIEDLLKTFKSTAKDRRAPEEDAVQLLDQLRKAYRYLESKGDELTKDEEDLKEDIVKEVSRGLRLRRRPLVTMECAKALGQFAHEDAVRPLVKWLDDRVLDAKTPNPRLVEHGFLALAYIGAEDSRTMDLLIKYGTRARHPDPMVANNVLAAVVEWRHLHGRNRKELFDKILGYIGGLYGNSKKSGSEGAQYKEKYERVKDNGLKALSELSGVKFKDPDEAFEWWKENKKARWSDYAGPRFRKKEAKDEKESS